MAAPYEERVRKIVYEELSDFNLSFRDLTPQMQLVLLNVAARVAGELEGLHRQIPHEAGRGC